MIHFLLNVIYIIIITKDSSIRWCKDILRPLRLISILIKNIGKLTNFEFLQRNFFCIFLLSPSIISQGICHCAPKILVRSDILWCAVTVPQWVIGHNGAIWGHGRHLWQGYG